MAGPISTATTNFSSTVTALLQPELERLLRIDLNFADPGTGHYQTAMLTTDHNELTPPTANDLGITVDTLTPSQYGATISITDLAAAESPQDLVASAAERIARHAAATADQIVANVTTVAATTYGDAGASAISGATVRKAVNKMRKSGVQPFDDGYFRAIISPEQYNSLQADTAVGGWVDSYKYTNAMPLLSNEVGLFGGCRFLLSARVPVATGVYSGIIFGPGGVAFGDLQTVSAHVVLPGGDHSDPLGQLALVGWKASFGVKLLAASGAHVGLLKSTETAL